MYAVIHPHYNHILGFGSTELKMNPALTPPPLPLSPSTHPPPPFLSALPSVLVFQAGWRLPLSVGVMVLFRVR